MHDYLEEIRKVSSHNVKYHRFQTDYPLSIDLFWMEKPYNGDALYALRAYSFLFNEELQYSAEWTTEDLSALSSRIQSQYEKSKGIVPDDFWHNTTFKDIDSVMTEIEKKCPFYKETRLKTLCFEERQLDHEIYFESENAYGLFSWSID